ncbi:MAG: response regulator [Xanthomonadales bacterium]|nr:response regulator [Xanthomonadales bacterium]
MKGNSGKDPATVLVVDDNDLVRDLVVEILESAQFNVLQADCGRQALELIDEQPTDCILLDYNLPEMKGTEVLAQIRARAIACRVISMSAQPLEAGGYLSEKAGFDGYLRKPFMPDELLKVVSAQVEFLD